MSCRELTKSIKISAYKILFTYSSKKPFFIWQHRLEQSFRLCEIKL